MPSPNANIGQGQGQPLWGTPLVDMKTGMMSPQWMQFFALLTVGSPLGRLLTGDPQGVNSVPANWQTPASTDNGYIRCLYASNIAWDQRNGVWQVAGATAGGAAGSPTVDWSAMVLLSAGVIGFACETGFGVAITAATNANPAVLTVVGHPFVTGNQIGISGFTGSWAKANGQFPVTVTGANTFSIPINSTAFGAIAGTPVIALPMTRTQTQFLAAIKLKVYPSGVIQMITGADQSSFYIRGSSPYNVVNGAKGDIAIDDVNGYVWINELGGLLGWRGIITALSGDGTAAGPGNATLTVTGTNGLTLPLSATLLATNASRQIIAAALASANIFVGSVGNLPVARAMNGDATMNSLATIFLKATGPGAGTYTVGGGPGTITLDAQGRVTGVT